MCKEDCFPYVKENISDVTNDFRSVKKSSLHHDDRF